MDLDIQNVKVAVPDSGLYYMWVYNSGNNLKKYIWIYISR